MWFGEGWFYFIQKAQLQPQLLYLLAITWNPAGQEVYLGHFSHSGLEHQMIPGVKINNEWLNRHGSTNPSTFLGSGLVLIWPLNAGSSWARMSKLYKWVAEVELQFWSSKKQPTSASFLGMAVCIFISYFLFLMYNLLCIMYYALCIMHYALCIMHYALCIIYYLLCIMYYVWCIMYYVLCSM
jgi:hypothetical protein